MLAIPYNLRRPRTDVLSRDNSQIAFVTSNTLAAISGRMQLLLHGWLMVAWGHNLLLLFGFAAARIAPKLMLTMPAGLVCDRFSRTRVLAAARWLDSLACLIPLAGFFLPVPLAWLVAGIVLSGATAAFDQPARKATVGDIASREQLGPLVALNSGTAHGAALVGTALAFILGPAGLVLAAALLAGGAFFARFIEPVSAPAEASKKDWDGVGGFFRFVTAAPLVAGLVLLAIAPLLVNKAMALALPSFHESKAILSLALVAPEVGGIGAAAALFLRPVNVPIAALVATLAFYVLVLTAGMSMFAGSAVIVVGMALGGICQTAFDTTSQVRIQQMVPRDLRGRVFAF